MADYGYQPDEASKVISEITAQLFGRPIPPNELTPQQREQVAGQLASYISKNPSSFGAAGTVNSLLHSGTRPVDPVSVARAQAVNQINDYGARTEANNKRLLNDLEVNTNQANFTDANAINSLTSAQEAARAGYRGVAANQRGLANSANDLSAQLFGGYAQGQAALNAQDQAGLADYLRTTQPLLTQQQARGSDPADVARQMGAYNQAAGIAGGSLDYTAAQYASNPADVARQQQMYNTLLGVGNGSLDYQAAQYQSNAADVARQLQGYNDLRGIGQGSLDWKSQAAQAYADQQDVGNQRLALERLGNEWAHGGDEQRQVLEKFKGLSDPEVTAKERFLSELARREFESGDRGSRAAASEALANRGLRSGGQQLAMTQAARQQLSQDRLLKELGVQAQAVDRSMQALGGWGTAANSLRSGDQNALGMYSNLATNLRNASFDEAYKRGLGADSASAANQATQLAGYAQSANQATNIRNASDAVGTFNVGQTNNARANNQATRLGGYQGAASQSNAIRTANDAVGTFNVGQVNNAQANNQATRMGGAQLQAIQSNAIRSANDSQRQYEDTFAQNEATRVGNLAGQRASETRLTTNQISGRQDNVFDAGRSTINDAYGRSTDANKTDWDVTSKDLDMAGGYFDAVTGAADRKVGRSTNLAATTSNITSRDAESLADRLGLSYGQWGIAQEKGLAEEKWY